MRWGRLRVERLRGGLGRGERESGEGILVEWNCDGMA